MPPRSRRLRAAAVELCQTLRTLRSGIGAGRLRDDAVAQCGRAIAAAVVDGDFEVSVHPGALCQGAVPVAQLGRKEPPFALLREAGIGRIVFERAAPLAAVTAFVRLLAELSPATAAGSDLLAPLHDPRFAAIRLLAPTDDAGQEPGRRAPIDWSLLPAATGTVALQRRAEATSRRNLHFAIARLLLADLDAAEPPAAPQIGQLCEDLFEDVLRRGDAGTAAWLLEQLQHHLGAGPELALALRSRADTAFASAWLDEQVAEPTQVDGLAALAIELGDAGLARLAAAAARAGAPLPPWLQELLEDAR